MDRRPNIDKAIAAMLEIWEQDFWISLERGSAACLVSPFARKAPGKTALDAAQAKTLHNQAALKEILPTPKKEWAERKDEFALSVTLEDGNITAAGAVLLEQRRVLGPGAFVGKPELLPERFKTCTGVIISQGQGSKEALAWWLWQAGMLRADVTIIQVPAKPGDDYRDLISGSHWLKAQVRPKRSEAIGSALFTAMQARSYRKEAIQAGGTKWWQALAAAHQARVKGITGEEACKSMGLSWTDLSKWIEKSLQFKPRQALPDIRQDIPVQREAALPDNASSRQSEHTPHQSSLHDAPQGGMPTGGTEPATDKQRTLASKLMTEIPELAPVFGTGWDRDKREASRTITRAIAAAEKLKAAALRYKDEVSTIVAAA
jgi:hypothetical protein